MSSMRLEKQKLHPYRTKLHKTVKTKCDRNENSQITIFAESTQTIKNYIAIASFANHDDSQPQLTE